MDQKRSARALGPADLIVDHFTLARHHPLEDRLGVVARGGAAGVGLYLGDLIPAMEAGLTFDALAGALDRHGLVFADIEVIRAFADGDDEDGARQRAFVDLAMRVADRFESRYLQVVGPTGPDLDRAAEQFARLCDRSRSRAGRRIEPLPFTDLKTRSPTPWPWWRRPTGPTVVSAWTSGIRARGGASPARSWRPCLGIG
ncbi:MAG: hypothetical protein R2715_19875 [Ilumatobacteraceae bacterium]